MTTTNRAEMMRGHAKDYYRQARNELRRARVSREYAAQGVSGMAEAFAQSLRDARALRHKARIHMAEYRAEVSQ